MPVGQGVERARIKADAAHGAGLGEVTHPSKGKRGATLLRQRVQRTGLWSTRANLPFVSLRMGSSDPSFAENPVVGAK
jgi:hypothetical protein